ncbi:MAG TPA: hypothetical protein VLC98_10240 [Phnomibacter sp.]|nr:hypothetical protein [Phnomibacter sp.]
MNQLTLPDDLEKLLAENNAVAVSSPEWFAQLKHLVQEMINYNFDGLLQMLYHVDVSEEKLRTTLAAFPANDAADLISDLLMERQLQKIKSRREFAQRDENIPEDEKW